MTGFRVALGGAQACRRAPGPDHARQNHRRRHAGRRIRRPPRYHGAARPFGSRLSSRNAVGNPVAMIAGITTLELLSEPGFHQRLGAMTDILVEKLAMAAARAGIALTTNHVCGMFGFSSPAEPIVDTLRQGHGLRCRALQAIFSRHAERRNVFRALGLRSGILVRGAFGGGHRSNRRRRRARFPR